MIGIDEAVYATAVSQFQREQKQEEFEFDDIFQFAASALTDTVLSTLDSITFGLFEEELDTGEALHWMNEDLGDYYDTHKDGIELASFVGGMIVPGLAAAKAFKWAKKGNTILGRATKAREVQRAKAITAVKSEGILGDQYRDAIRSIRYSTLAEGVAEGMLYEASFMLFNNRHPYMEEDYDVQDFAIGAALGALVGPARLIGSEYDLRKTVLPLLAKGEKVKPHHGRYHALDQGTEISYLGGNIYKAKKQQAAGWQGLSEQMGREADEGIVAAYTELNKQVRSMMSEDLAKLKAPSKKATLGTYLNDDILQTSPADIIMEMTTRANGAMAGVGSKSGRKAITEFSDRVDIDDLVNKIYKSDELNQIHEIDRGGNAALVFMKKRIGRSTEGLEWPTNLQTKVGHGGVRILESTGPLSNNDLNYITNELLNGRFKDIPIELRGEVLYGLKASRQQAHQLINIERLELENKFIAESKLIDKYVNPSQIPEGGVIHPYFGANILGEVEGLANLTASMDTNVAVRTRIGLKDDLIYAATDSVSKTDAQVIEGIQFAKDITWGTAKTLKEGEWSKLQGLVLRYRKQGLKWHPMQIGDTTLANVDAAEDYLWAVKRDIITDIISDKVGGSIKQAAIKANLPLDIAELIAIDPKLSKGSHNPFRYDKLLPDTYSSYKGIKLRGNSIRIGQSEEAATAAWFDADVMQKVSDTYVQAAVTKSRVPEIKELNDQVLFGENMIGVRDNLEQTLVNLGDKKTLWTSVDQSLRSLGALGNKITTLGRDFRDITNRLYKRHQISLEGVNSAVARDATSSTQYSMLRQTLQTLGIKDAQKLQYDETLGKIGWLSKDKEGNMVVESFLKYTGTEEDIVFTPTMKIWAKAYLPIMHEHLDILNVSKDMWGKPLSKGAGFWIPYEDLNNKLVVFKVGKGKNKSDISMIVGHNAKDLDSKVLKHKTESGNAFDFVYRDTGPEGAAQNWATYNNMAEFGEIRRANLNLRKSGIAVSEVVPGGVDIGNLLPDLQANLWNHMRNITRSANSAVFDQLRQATKMQTQAAESGAGFLAHQRQRRTSTPEVVEKVLLNMSQLPTQPLMDMSNNWVGAQMNQALHKGGKLFRDARGDKGYIKDWTKLRDDLAEAGIPNPWKDALEYATAAKGIRGGEIAQHRIAQAQSILVSMNLKLLELSHAAVTVMSLPVILSAEARFLREKGERGIMKTMIDAAKFMMRGSDEARDAMAFGDKMTYTKGIVSELTELMRDLPTETKLGKKYKEVLDYLSMPSNAAENLSREYSYALGHVIAKQKYPTASARVLATEANAFTTRTMGNYISRQKPVLFQGTFGAMLGLYQTFMLTMGQNLFRYAEKGNRKAITQLMSTQAAVFGLESLPFFNDFNRMMGEYASDEHNDMITTVYNVFGNNEDQNHSMAEYILFGLPSATFGTAVYTRATLDPRTPFGFTPREGFSVKPPIVDAIVQAGRVTSTTIQDMYKAAQTGGNIYDIGQVALQGVAAQSLWRPGARYAEMLGLGKSFDQKGEVISGTGEVSFFDTDTWANEPFSLMARAIGARPLKEQALRNLRFNVSYYNGIDRDRNAKVKKQVRRIISDPSTDLNQLDNLFSAYIDNGGKYQGWKQVLNGAYMESDTQFAHRLHEHVEKQPAISEIAETYGY